ncbi:Rab geranylgeranyltransferase [Extremus antarcticus]|uniref:Geranylgeranyl transferase type-2 subunit alpha n=1 Tax=Extremus antarcticus TaxID=702011 RepID=A0AAJ0DDQ1_9PEZI|nr:Rab geranylgeranyltransferase [Extremus antarcticus]
MSHGVPRVGGEGEGGVASSQDKIKARIKAYKELEKDVTDRIKNEDYSNTTFQLTSTLLSQNPEYYTIWNHRRLLLQHVFAREFSTSSPDNPTAEGTLSTSDDHADTTAAQKAGLSPSQHEISLLISEDLSSLLPLLKQYPKCYWIWNHRSWLLTKATTHLPAASAIKFWQGELALVGKMLALDSRNFHGWGYRRTVVEAIERLGDISMAEKEFEYTTKMIKTNLSNFSAWHYRSQLIPRLLNERNARREARAKFLDGEFELITSALYTDPYDQSLWFYHQFLMATLDTTNPQAGIILSPCTNSDRKMYLEQEVTSVREMLDGAEDCKYIYQALLEYARRWRDLGGEVEKTDMKEWLGELRKLDPLREGRWRDLEKVLGLEVV